MLLYQFHYSTILISTFKIALVTPTYISYLLSSLGLEITRKHSSFKSLKFKIEVYLNLLAVSPTFSESSHLL